MRAPPADTGYDEHLRCDVLDLRGILSGRRFDYIVAAEFIEHVERPYDVLRVFHTLLEDDGTLVLTTPNPIGFPVFAYEWMNSTRRFFAPNHAYYILPRWMVHMLRRSGFETTLTKGVGIWPTLIPCPVTISYQVLYVARKCDSGQSHA